jgi:inactivated superfamily I helicase
MAKDGDGFDGGSGSMDWRFAPPDQLVINGQSCRVLPGSDDKQLFMSRCVFRGVWLRQPERTTADGKAGPK